MAKIIRWIGLSPSIHLKFRGEYAVILLMLIQAYLDGMALFYQQFHHVRGLCFILQCCFFDLCLSREWDTVNSAVFSFPLCFNARHFLSWVAKEEDREKRGYHQRNCSRYDFNRGVFNCIIIFLDLAWKRGEYFYLFFFSDRFILWFIISKRCGRLIREGIKSMNRGLFIRLGALIKCLVSETTFAVHDKKNSVWWGIYVRYNQSFGYQHGCTKTIGGRSLYPISRSWSLDQLWVLKHDANCRRCLTVPRLDTIW